MIFLHILRAEERAGIPYFDSKLIIKIEEALEKETSAKGAEHANDKRVFMLRKVMSSDSCL